VTLQVMQQKLQADNTRVVIEKIVEDAKQAIAQCTAEVAVIRIKLDGLHAKISMTT